MSAALGAAQFKTRVARRVRVLTLYRACLAAARACPRFEHALQMKFYARARFRDAAGVQDPALIDSMLAEGEEELATMEYYTRVREAKDAGTEAPDAGAVALDVKVRLASLVSEALDRRSRRIVEEATALETAAGGFGVSSRGADGPPVLTVAALPAVAEVSSPSSAEAGRAKFCPGCGTPFLQAAKFCIECGSKRP